MRRRNEEEHCKGKDNSGIRFTGQKERPHFIVGMTKSKLIININKDEKAKIFNQSDYGVVGDAAKIMNALNELL